MTPEPEPDCAWDVLAGTPRVRMVTTDERTFETTAGTVRFFSLVPFPPAPAHAEPERKQMMRLAILRTREMAVGNGIKSRSFSHNCPARKSHAKKTG